MQSGFATLSQETVAANRKPRRAAWLLLSPLIFWLVVFVIAPTLILGIYSFCERGSNGPVAFHFTWENYRRIADPTYLWIFARSLFYAGITTILCVLMGYPVAWFIGRSPQPRRDRLLLFIMIPFWTSFLIRTFAWITILKESGFLNAFLMAARIIPEPLEILYTPVAVVIGLVYTYLPFMILPIYGSVEKLDPALLEAASDLGAAPAQSFWRVILPLTMPGIVAGVLLVFVPAIGMFAVSDLLGGKRVPLIGNVIQNQFGAAQNWPFGAALGMTLLAIFMLVYFVSARREA